MSVPTDALRQVGSGGFLVADAHADAVFTREDLSDEQLLFGRVAEEFMRTEVVPNERALEHHDWELTRALIRKAAERDLTRLEIPEAYGGLGLDKVSTACTGEYLAINPSFAGSLGAHTSIGTLPIVYFGTAEQRARYLPRLASGELISAYALTEPEAGSDALSSRTTATLSDDGRYYTLRGQKLWITNGGFADLFTLFAKVDGKHFTAFIVERSMGVVSGSDEQKLGLNGSSTTALMLDDCRVPVENVLGNVGEGHKIAFNILNVARVKLGTRNIGGAKQALNRAVQYAAERRQFGRPIAEFGLIKHKLAEMAVRCFVGDAMVFRTLGDVDAALRGVDSSDVPAVLKTIEEFAVECSINKVWTSEALAYAVDESLQVFGGNGYSREFPAERAYRDARITRIYEGTNEINRLIIGTRLAKGPAAAESSDAASALLDRSPRGGQPPDRLAPERDWIARAKRAAVTTLREATRALGSRFSSEQEVVAQVADMAMDIYAAESALLRAEKLARADSYHAATAADIACVYIDDAANRLAHAASTALNALDLATPEPLLTNVRDMLRYRSFDAVRARRRIADVVIAANRYPL